MNPFRSFQRGFSHSSFSGLHEYLCYWRPSHEGLASRIPSLPTELNYLWLWLSGSLRDTRLSLLHPPSLITDCLAEARKSSRVPTQLLLRL